MEKEGEFWPVDILADLQACAKDGTIENYTKGNEQQKVPQAHKLWQSLLAEFPSTEHVSHIHVSTGHKRKDQLWVAEFLPVMEIQWSLFSQLREAAPA